MRKPDWALLISTLAYTAMFYEQNAGLNFLIFNIVFIALLWWIDPEKIKNKKGMFLSFCCLFSSLCILITGSSLAILANVISLLLLSASALNQRSSLITDLLSGVYSTVAALIFMIRDLFAPKRPIDEQPERKPRLRILVYLSTTLLIFLFFSIYQNANPLFKQFTKNINLDFISFKWLFFTFGGLLVSYALIKNRRVQEADNWEVRQESALDQGNLKPFHPIEKQGLLILFAVLNVMLLFINALDVNYLYLGAGLPDGITHKQFVHQGVNMLILSIVFGICIVLYAFRGSLNYDTNNNTVKVLVYAWLAQNLMMVVSTALRNHMYIHEALLTYKRIGVYYWLVMAALGILTTIYKVYATKRNWFLLRSNSLFATILLVGSAVIDWDLLISNYNIAHVKHVKDLDKKYLLSLSEGNIKQLYALRNHPQFETDTIYHYQYIQKYSNRRELDKKLYLFLNADSGTDWRSFNFRRSGVYSDIKALSKEGVLDSLNLSTCPVRNVTCLRHLSSLKQLQLPGRFVLTEETVEELNQMPSLQTLLVPNLANSEMPLVERLQHIKKIRMLQPSDYNRQWAAERKKSDLIVEW